MIRHLTYFIDMASRDAEEHQGDLDPELLAKGIVDEESEIPYLDENLPKLC
ncbi:12043_t:CDS:2 [Funneliformis geosporum]|uniref:12043_t:CDS:1 n=1 Tax=Funneliformis geosporum TaxID=1117311 RepID=A0A9W4WTF4_9GLOM|nr:12043_t:CDS:2 [Funneliformis geosporum]